MARTYSCELCHRYAKNDAPDAQTHLMCDDCSQDHREVVALYNQIITRFPQYKSLSPSQVFERIYNKVLENRPPTSDLRKK